MEQLLIKELLELVESKTDGNPPYYEFGMYGVKGKNGGQLFDTKNKKFISVVLRDDGIYFTGKDVPDEWEER